MDNINSNQVDELIDTVKLLIKEQEKMVFYLEELKKEQERLLQEIRFQNIVLSILPNKNETLN